MIWLINQRGEIQIQLPEGLDQLPRSADDQDSEVMSSIMNRRAPRLLLTL